MPPQVILRVMANPAMVVMGFDIQASKVVMYFENGLLQSMATPSAVASLRHMTIFADPATQSTSYAQRLDKYSRKKGFGVCVPLLDRRITNLDAISSPDATGLAQLLRTVINGCVNTASEKEQRDASDYDVGLQIRYVLYQKLLGEGSFLRWLKTKLRVKSTVMPIVNWVQTPQAMSQVLPVLFTNSFHPCERDFYADVYGAPVNKLALAF